ncbi:tRNA glutamyl-Q(34) synthetase GluQRS, partial [Achromobacter aegrifaciens]|uniref:tRNA glutamyl-Q(34) synthetase GluQRS n=1 Tax=Achromobacter aegrifaciens TaxID=1287736 RepID=UPI0028A76C57
IEDVDTPRTVPGAAEVIMGQLSALGLDWDGDIMWQSRRGDAYQVAFDSLAARGLIYGCGCTRREIADSALRGQTAPGADGERPYPGTCRHGLPPGREARAWRVVMPEGVEHFVDRWLGPQEQNVAQAVGDIALRRADGLWAYQLAVVVDDAAQGVTDVVRGADLLSSTARQRVLGRLLGLPPVRYLHVPLILDASSGLKLSKQNGAPPIDTGAPLAALMAAWRALGFDPIDAADRGHFLREATAQWARRFPLPAATAA